MFDGSPNIYGFLTGFVYGLQTAAGNRYDEPVALQLP